MSNALAPGIARRRDAGRRLTSLEICAGVGGLALGLEMAGFDPVLLIEELPIACETLRKNRPSWDVREMDIRDFDPTDAPQVFGVDLLSAGLPRLKATAANARARGAESEVDLMRTTLRLTSEVRPRCVLIDNVPDLVSSKTYFPLRDYIRHGLEDMGYRCNFLILNAADFNLAQDRKHGFVVGLDSVAANRFLPPLPASNPRTTVGEVLAESMRSSGWPDADSWAHQARILAPTIVGGSWERGGADLGPTGTKRAWARIGVDGGTVSDAVPRSDFAWMPRKGRQGMVRLTVEQTAILQGFPDDWHVAGRKTARYRQIANAVPPPLAYALGLSISSSMRF
ncbi:DNA cytosine methyltransferase [Rhodococcus oxybenzonivorans]|uniref:DNA (cytosine-5-)-methyltransferase n=1 Tax=Rhodococcus oxybenzonivorans TaxID=1990687 RepID=A0A2S2BTC0_9NOCA|nr:DNA cytosine methyltransferase [Rhodococcus oxybenzonivorans]AWK71832.1 DNA cytosine methyltransferase [Rhodococcus oxybenzonivorans]